MLVTRIAPTPSGYLHVGNAVNFLLTNWLARAGGGRLLLRIDDFDTGRVRADYLADIFVTLRWLGIEADAGPRDPQEFASTWTMARRTEQFRNARDHLLATHPERVFVCRCSRRALDPQGRCREHCSTAGLPWEPGRTVVRLRVPGDQTVQIGPDRCPVPIGDHVLWRRDDLPAYHLGSVIVDEDLGVTAVVRGTDLLESSALQRHLAALLPAPAFAAADLRHHGLLVAPDGHKLSKSAGAQAHPMNRSAGLRDQITAWALDLGAGIAVGPPPGP